MRRNLAALLALAIAAGARLPAQTPLGGSLVGDSLTPTKAHFRDAVSELRDTLTRVQATTALIGRAHRSGMSSVVASQARELQRRCRSGAAMTGTTKSRIANLRTSADEGNRALTSYRTALDDLDSSLVACARDDSLALGATQLDADHVEEIGAAATAAIDRYDRVRDALLGLLEIRLPVAGAIYH